LKPQAPQDAVLSEATPAGRTASPTMAAFPKPKVSSKRKAARHPAHLTKKNKAPKKKKASKLEAFPQIAICNSPISK